MGASNSSACLPTYEKIKNMPLSGVKDMLTCFEEQVMFFGIGEKQVALLLEGDTEWAKQIIAEFGSSSDT